MENLRHTFSREDLDYLLMLDDEYFEWFLKLYPEHSRLGLEHRRRRPWTRIRMETEQVRREVLFCTHPLEMKMELGPRPDRIDVNEKVLNALLQSLGKPAKPVFDQETVHDASDLRLYPIFRQVIAHVRDGIRLLDIQPDDKTWMTTVSDIVEKRIRRTYEESRKVNENDTARDACVMTHIWGRTLDAIYQRTLRNSSDIHL